MSRKVRPSTLRVFHSLCSRKREEPQRCTSNAALQNYNIRGFGMEESAQG
jgi:hypothetical protein